MNYRDKNLVFTEKDMEKSVNTPDFIPNNSDNK